MKPIEQVSGRTRTVVLTGFALMTGLLAWYGYLLLSDSSDWIGKDIAYFGVMVLATCLCAARSLLVSFQRPAWTLVTGVLIANLIAELTSYYLELPFPSIADVFWLLSYLLMLGVLVALVAPAISKGRKLLLLDWLIATLTVSAVGVLTLLPPIFDAQPDASFSSVIAVTYPIADLVILSALIVVLFTGTRRGGPAIALVVAAGIVWLTFDAMYSYQTAVGQQVEVLDFGYPFALGLLGAATWAPATLRIDRMTLIRRTSRLSGICVLVALGVLLIREFQPDPNLASFILAIGAVAGGGVRLILAQRENRRLLDVANTDHLTGIPSRGRLSADTASYDGSPVTVAMLDLDGFKFYNDSFGHPAGDALLQKIATQLVEVAGDEADVYRIGGDEFCVLIEGHSEVHALLLEALARATVVSGDGFEISASLGVADCPREAKDILTAISLADERMYAQKNSASTSARSQVHEVLVRSLREREPELAAHTSKVRGFATVVAREMVTSHEELDVIERAAELHDVGKVAIPDSILMKSGRLDPEEWELMKQHTVIGERIISASAALAPVGKLVRHSHEHWDGGGYPDGLAGDEIPLGSRIILACDALEAMTSQRPYSKAVTVDEALAELETCSNRHFDATVMTTLGSLVRSGEVSATRGEPSDPDATGKVVGRA